MPSWRVSIDAWMSVVPGDRRDGPAEDQVPGVVLRRQEAAGVVGQGEVAADVLVGVVVEVVLDADLVER